MPDEAPFGSEDWRYLVDAFRNGDIRFDFPLHQILTVCGELAVNVDV